MASENYLEALFDDAEDILAEEAGLVTIEQPGLVVLCPVIFEQGTDAPGNIPLSEGLPSFPNTFYCVLRKDLNPIAVICPCLDRKKFM